MSILACRRKEVAVRYAKNRFSRLGKAGNVRWLDKFVIFTLMKTGDKEYRVPKSQIDFREEGGWPLVVYVSISSSSKMDIPKEGTYPLSLYFQENVSYFRKVAEVRQLRETLDKVNDFELSIQDTAIIWG